MASLGRERQRLQTTIQLAERLRKADDELAEARELTTSDDPEMAAEARSEVERLTTTIRELEDHARPLLIPHDPLDDRPAHRRDPRRHRRRRSRHLRRRPLSHVHALHRAARAGGSR